MRKAFIQLHIAVILAGFTGILGRLITLNEGLLVWYRLLISAITMWILFSLTKKIQKIAPKEILKITGIGFIAAIHWVTFYGAIKYANVSVALICFSAISFFTAIIEPLLLKKKIIYIEMLLGLLTMAGIYIIFHFDPQYKTGIIFGLISAVLAAIFPVCNRQLMQKMNAETLMTYELSGGFLTLSLLLPFYLQQFPANHLIPTSNDFLWLLVLSWLCSVWAFQLSANALKKISAFTVNLTYSIEPVYGIILAFVVYNENKYLHNSFYIGLLFIIIAVSLQMLRVYKKKAG